jgi:hypothetical protein
MRGSVRSACVSLTTTPRLHRRPVRFGQRRVGADAGGHHHQVGRDLAAVLEAHRARGRRAGNSASVCAPISKRMPRASSDCCSSRPAGLVELALHQPRHDVHHGDLHAAQHQAVGGFQAEQAAADDHGVRYSLRGVDHGLVSAMSR